MTDFPLNLITLRKYKGLTQSELSDILNVNRVTIGDYERGKSEPSLIKLKEIAGFFRCDIDVLFWDNNRLIKALENKEECKDNCQDERKDESNIIPNIIPNGIPNIKNSTDNDIIKELKTGHSKASKKGGEQVEIREILEAQKCTIDTLTSTVTALLGRIKNLESQIEEYNKPKHSETAQK